PRPPAPHPPPPPPPGTFEPLTTFPVPPNYGLHDTFIRDGVAFLFVWNSGVTILDVGGGGHGGTPAEPVTISTFVPNQGSLPTPSIHNGWYFNNPSGSQRYLFLGQEGPGTLGAASAGDIKVLDVTNLEQ